MRNLRGPLVLLVILVFSVSNAFGTVLYRNDSETFTVGGSICQTWDLPHYFSNIFDPPYYPDEMNPSVIAQSANSKINKYIHAYFQNNAWLGTSDGPFDEMQNRGGTYGPATFTEGGTQYNLSGSTTYYLAFYFNIEMIGDPEYFTGNHCSEKGIGLENSDRTLRAGVGFGFWGENSACYSAGLNKYTILLKSNADPFSDGSDSYSWGSYNWGQSGYANGSYQENNYCQNQSGYTCNSCFMMDYNRWYSVVFEIQPATSAGGNGHVKWYVNGTLVGAYYRIRTTDAVPAPLGYIENWGTVCQGCASCPDNYHNLDNIVFANSVDDINANGTLNYFADPEGTTPPSAQGCTISGSTYK